MDKYNQLKALIAEVEPEFSKFYESGNKAAGTRIRKAMQQLKVLAQEVRLAVQESKNKE